MKRVVCVGSRRIEYTLVQSVRKTILLQALPEGETRVYAPKYARLRDIDALVRRNAAEIDRLHGVLDRRLDEERRAHPVFDGSTFSLEGRPCTLCLHGQDAKLPRGELREDGFHLWLNAPESEEAVRAALKSVLAARALERIRERISFYHPRIGGETGRVTVRDQRSRWGSCSAKHNLSFNWKLILAPAEALDYVVVHELCHLHEFNHSPRFWRLVEAQLPQYEVWKKWLKNHGGELGV